MISHEILSGFLTTADFFDGDLNDKRRWKVLPDFCRFLRFVNAAHGKIMVSLKVFFPMWKFEKKSFTIYLILIFINLFQGIPAKENI